LSSFSNDHVSVDRLSRFSRLDYLYRHLTQLHCATIVVENEYVDGDYLDDYAQYYAKCFKPYGRFCKRLHFFSVDFSSDEFADLVHKKISAEQEPKLVSAYLGFAVAKPLPEAIIGRTVLPTPPSPQTSEFPAIRKCEVNLYGLPLQVKSLPFQEQDTVVGACATSALWSAFQKTCYLYGKEAPTPATITQLATRHFLSARVLPSHGLNVQQICEAIRGVGLEPEVFTVRPDVPIVSLVNAYLRAGLPAILALDVKKRGLHAVTVLGYSVEAIPVRDREVSPRQSMLPLQGLSIGKFYVHDDQIGPFAEITIHPGNGKYPVRFKGMWVTPAGEEAWLVPEFVIIPVYHKIRIKFLEVLKWPKYITEFLESLGWTQPLGPLSLRWDVYLTTVNTLREELRSRGLGADFAKAVLIRSHPRFIWRVTAYHNVTPLFVVLADATDIARSFLPYFLWFEHPGFGALVGSQLGQPDWDNAVRRYLSSNFLQLLGEAVFL
jgi:hypothetical protein